MNPNQASAAEALPIVELHKGVRYIVSCTDNGTFVGTFVRRLKEGGVEFADAVPLDPDESQELCLYSGSIVGIEAWNQSIELVPYSTLLGLDPDTVGPKKLRVVRRRTSKPKAQE